MKTTCLVLMMSTFVVTPAFAADSSDQKASTGTVATAPSSKESMSAPANPTPQHRTQRTAGTPSVSPALALAMALGYRSVQGPVERRPAIIVSKRAVTPNGMKQGFMLPSDGAYKKTSSNAAGVRMALEN